MEGQQLHVHLLGGFLLVEGDTPVTQLHAPRLQALLTLLLLKRETPQPRHYLALCLWPDSSEAQAQTNLRNLLHQLRQQLPRAERFLTLDGHTLWWRADAPFTLDVAAFERALDAAAGASPGDAPAARAHLEEALARYQGDLLPACYDDWIVPERERLRQRYLAALEQLIALLERQRDYRAAAQYARRLIEAEPLQETAYLWLMRLQMLRGDRAAALHTFQGCADTLRRDLGVEPGNALREAYARIVATAASGAPAHQHGRSLIGRDLPWQRLLSCWQRATAGEALLCLVVGEVGIGKSRLAEELLRWAARQGLSCGRAACYAAEGELLYAPVIAWLGEPAFRAGIGRLPVVWRNEIARLAPELLDSEALPPNPAPITEPWQRRRLFEGLARAVLGARAPILLVLDDLHWCDRATLTWLPYLLRAASRSGLLLVCAARSDELDAAEGARELLDALRGQGQLAELELGPLDEPESAALAAQVLGRALEQDEAALLQRESEGNPLFIVEAARAILDRQRPRADADAGPGDEPAGLAMPPRIRAALGARLDRLSPRATALVELAATCGRVFNGALLARASGLTEEDLVHGLDELWRCKIIRERGDQGYDFSHEKLRELVYGRLSRARRQQLHRAVAEALAPEVGGIPTLHNAALAGHYVRAGHVAAAARAHIAAAEAGRRVYANHEAASACRAALALLEQAPAHELAPPLRAELTLAAQRTLAEALHAGAQFAEARAACMAALALVPPDDHLGRARLHRLTASTWWAQALFDEAGAAFRLAEQALGPPPAAGQAALWQAWVELRLDRAEALLWQGRADAVAEDELEQLQQAVLRYGTAAHQSRLLMLRLIAAFWAGHCAVDTTALERIDRIIALSECSGDPQLIAMSAWIAGQSRLLRHELERADDQIRRALGLAEQSGDLPLQARCLGGLSIVARRRGDLKLAQAYTERGGALAEAYGFSDVLGTIEASRAWLAWRAADHAAAEQHGRKALDRWRQSPILFPFQWTARLPLLAVALARGALGEAVEHAQALLAPTQQRLPPELASALATAVDPPMDGRHGALQGRLHSALALAQSLGLL